MCDRSGADAGSRLRSTRATTATSGDEQERSPPASHDRRQGTDGQAEQAGQREHRGQERDHASPSVAVGQVARGGEGGGHDDRRADPVEEPRRQQERQRWGDDTGTSGHDEDAQAEHQGEASAATVRDGAQCRGQQGRREGIGAGQQTDHGDRRLEVVRDRRQQGRHDVGVDPDREDRQDEGKGDRHRRILDRRGLHAGPVRRRRYHRRGSGGVPVGPLVFKTSGVALGAARWVRLPCAPASRRPVPV